MYWHTFIDHYAQLFRLQAWERLPILRLQYNIKIHSELPDIAPYGVWWDVRFDITQLATHVLVIYQDQLDLMTSDKFTWMSYQIKLISRMLEQYLDDSTFWRTVVPLICWEIDSYIDRIEL